MTRSEGHIPSGAERDRRPRAAPRPGRADRPHDGGEPPRHPTGRAALLLIGVTLLIVVLAALSSFGHL